ncbi:MAG: M15 family metallopeptidase [Candidatus Sericytochromatia bacterium]|nr:M15 family metallopeptidase [Candidatus Sericytochromatia bacterium]
MQHPVSHTRLARYNAVNRVSGGTTEGTPPTPAQMQVLRAELQQLQETLDHLLRTQWVPPPARVPSPPPPPPPVAAPPPPPPPPLPAPPPPSFGIDLNGTAQRPRAETQEGAGPVLRRGLRGEPVRALQRRLAELGIDPGPVDGLFGPRTDAAVRTFQRARRLHVDGVVGPETWKALGIAVAGDVTSFGIQATFGDAVDRLAPVPLATRQGHQMHVNLVADWDRMVAAASRDGVNLQITSGYRSVELQARLFREAVSKYGSEDAARKWVAPPGRSNHQRGKALDIADNGGAHAWLRANGRRFGFYQPMSWEPWHWEHDI